MSPHLDHEQSSHRRQRRRESRRLREGDTPESRLARNSWLFLLAILFVVALIPLVDPWSAYSNATNRLAGTAVAGFVTGPIARILAAELLIAVLIATLLHLRWRILRRVSWWNDACPRCHQTELRRIRRIARDRLVDRLGIPARRYLCRECRWNGLRLDAKKAEERAGLW